MPGFQWSSPTTWGPAIRQSAGDAQRAIAEFEQPSIPGISSGVNQLNRDMDGGFTGYYLNQPGTRGGVLGGLQTTLYETQNIKGDIQDLQTNPVYGSAVTAPLISDIDAWVHGDEEPFGYFEFGKYSLTGAVTDGLILPATSGDAYSVGQALRDGGVPGRQAIEVGLTRLISSPLFLMCRLGEENEEPPNGYLNLASVDPSAQNAGETDLAFLQRVMPLLVWTNPCYGVPVPGTIQLQNSGEQFVYLYYPQALSAYPFMRLWDYIPSSGLPYRNGITDYVRYLSLIPLSF